ncbi:fungal specific transcription factor domain containing protein [Niveomyces insectorum RCEF 264]|uniref:Fungal specific transcription factor domain containing protein n=1 Tax=Niveomyces insectorum RCEF 264 TaxID=1081102 RepID=A0A167TEL3_9HYPO|nr:fungal specific transcription factor domain containing protein [Niveomyces insectorum RCEF 264]
MPDSVQNPASLPAGNATFNAYVNPGEDWTKISNFEERRRVQSRIAQRKYRMKQKQRREQSESDTRSRGPTTERMHDALVVPNSPAFSLAEAVDSQQPRMQNILDSGTQEAHQPPQSCPPFANDCEMLLSLFHTDGPDLHGRIELIEALIKQHRLQNRPGASTESTDTTLLSTGDNILAPANLGGPIPFSRSQMLSDPVGYTVETGNGGTEKQQMDTIGSAVTAVAMPALTLPTTLTATVFDESIEPFVYSSMPSCPPYCVSDSTMGDLDSLDSESASGRPQHDGPMPYFSAAAQPRKSLDAKDSENMAGQLSAVPDRGAGGYTVDMDSPQLRDVLLRSCWASYERSIRVVDEQLFLVSRSVRVRSQYYSDFLETCLLACATRTSTSPTVRQLGKAYADKAKQAIASELEQPTIGTVQGCLLLSDFEATSTRDGVGWTYNGIALRLLFDLGLQEDSAQPDTHGILLEADESLRHTLLPGAFVHDKLWSLFLNRPSCVPFYALEKSQRFAAPGSTLEHWITLCKHLSSLKEAIDNAQKEPKRGALDRLLELGAQIRTSHSGLPPPFCCQQMADLDITAYGLNMQFCGLQIVLHRAIVKILDQRMIALDFSELAARVDKSRNIMYENAMCICKLVRAYREILGIESFLSIMLDSTYMAASTLVSHVLRPPSVSDWSAPPAVPPPHSVSNSLDDVSETLAALQRHYPVAAKMRCTLASLCEGTFLAATFGPPDEQQQRGEDPASLGRMHGCSTAAAGGSWGSIEALVRDDVVLGRCRTLKEKHNGRP